MRRGGGGESGRKEKIRMVKSGNQWGKKTLNERKSSHSIRRKERWNVHQARFLGRSNERRGDEARVGIYFGKKTGTTSVPKNQNEIRGKKGQIRRKASSARLLVQLDDQTAAENSKQPGGTEHTKIGNARNLTECEWEGKKASRGQGELSGFRGKREISKADEGKITDRRKQISQIICSV